MNSRLLSNRIAPIPDAYHWIHKVTDVASPERTLSLRRFAFEEVLSVQLSMQRRKRDYQEQAAFTFSSASALELFQALVPFEPTNAQIRTLNDVIKDMSGKAPMSRLLQGDVGSGKTAVCAAACLVAVKEKAQCAILAPTDILVEQHLANFKKWFTPLGFRVAKLTASQKEAEKRAILIALMNGEIDIIVGTRALLSEGVAFHKLALAIIDEQHRFGVAQRRALREKGEAQGKTPHLLVMTATPIPRSLALTLYGDMSLSVIDELPKGRSPVTTQIVLGDAHTITQRLSAKMIREGEQAYVIFPLVQESEKLDLRNAVQAYETLCREFGAEHFAMVHGQMKADAKEAAMKQFASGAAKILISTTVVEVGVDVPNATYMLIMNAERFGLSQLHQLRGRVGRGHKPSFCYLAAEKATNENAKRRLMVMERTTNGFDIADEDLLIRGPGDMLGSRQSGLELFSFFDFAHHGDLIELARVQAAELLARDPELKTPWAKPLVERADTFLSC
jgi:ATP-dependent DNA helicase RecG